MKTQSHKTGNDRAAYFTLNDPKASTNRDASIMLSKNPIAKSVVQILHRDRYTTNDFMPSIGGIRDVSDTISDKIRVFKEIQEQLPDIKAAKRIRTSMILSPHDLMTVALNYKCEDSFLPPELVRAMLDNIRSVFDTSEYDIKSYLKRITDDITVDTGSYALAVIPEPTINDVINAPNTLAIESILTKQINQLNNEANRSLVFGVATEGFTNIKCDANEKLFSRKNNAIKRSDILNYTIVESIANIQIGVLKSLRNDVRMKRKYATDFKAVEGYDEVICGDSNNIAVEDNNQAELEKFKNEIFHTKPTVIHNAIKINQTDWTKRPAVGHPMTIHYPSECVIPIHVPGDPTQHIGYLVLTGSDNSPLTSVKNSPAFDMFKSGSGYGGLNNGTTYGEVISSIGRYQHGEKCDYKNGFLPSELLSIAKRIIEDDVSERLYNGTYNSSSQSVSCPENVALIMLSYRLADMQVNLQFIPANLMTYFALDYDELGVGRSSLDDVKLIASLRAAIQIADTMAGIKNSIGNTKLDINVDPLAQNAQQTVESMIQRVASVRAMTPILNNNPPATIAQFMAGAYMQVSVTAEGKGGDDLNPIPETTVEVSEEAPNYPGPSEELKEDLRNKSLLGVGVPKELVDAASSIDFAASIIYSNLMLNKQTLEDQAILNTHLTNHVRQFTMNSGRLMGMFVESIRSLKDKIATYLKGRGKFTSKQLIDEFVDHLEVRLPEPNNTRHEAQLTSLNAYIDLVNNALDICIKEGMIGKVISSVYNKDDDAESGLEIDQLVSIIKMDLVRKFMQANGILPELFDLFDNNDELANIVDVINSMGGDVDIAVEAYNQLKQLVNEKVAVVEGMNKAIGADSNTDGSNPPDGYSSDIPNNDDNPLDFNFDGESSNNNADADAPNGAEKDSNDENSDDDANKDESAKPETSEATNNESDEPVPVE